MTMLTNCLPSWTTVASAFLVLLLLITAWVIQGVSPETLLAMYRIYAQGTVCQNGIFPISISVYPIRSLFGKRSVQIEHCKANSAVAGK